MVRTKPVPGENTLSRFIGNVRHEFAMSIRRPGFWIAYSLLFLFYIITAITPATDGSNEVLSAGQLWPEAGHTVFMFNIFLPLLAGILVADRIWRDFRSNVRELQRSTPITIHQYILAKYIGSLASVLTPMLIIILGVGASMIARGLAPIVFIWPLVIAFLSIAVPAHIFIVAFSLVCPMVMPLRVYQVLFTGYWFWGNLLSPKAFPTISDTLLNAVGQYPLQAYFGVLVDSTHSVEAGFTRTGAMFNLAVLVTCAAIVLFTAERYLLFQERRA
jgi:ABC-2 type transport system permease protein